MIENRYRGHTHPPHDHESLTFEDMEKNEIIFSFSQSELIANLVATSDLAKEVSISAAGEVEPARESPSALREKLDVWLSKPRVNHRYYAYREAFNNAVRSAIRDDKYEPFVAIHADMSHMMHGFHGPDGALRFLPWHRVYLYEFEKMLQRYEPDLRIPYWDWVNDHEIPSWVDPPAGVTRGPDTSLELPTQSDLNARVLAQTSYEGFTNSLERSPFHNRVHNWVGGNTMPNPSISPRDPIFWLLHANVDRIWDYWQRSNDYRQPPPLSGVRAWMDPWPLRADDVEVTYRLRYYYRSDFSFLNLEGIAERWHVGVDRKLLPQER